jgi:N-acetylneuraminic acid mutarotase
VAAQLVGVAVLLALLIVPGVVLPTGAGAAGWQASALPASYIVPLATLLPDGRVLAVYGKNSALRSRSDDTWTALTPFDGETAGGRLIALADGQALLAGGVPSTMLNNPFSLTKQVRRFDPAKNVWTKEADMPTGRAAHTMTALADGRVLVVGGVVSGLSPRQPATTVGQVEIYDPATKSWTATAPLAQPRFGHTATLLPDGRVLVVGGSVSKTVNSENAGSETLGSVEIYSPATGRWEFATPLTTPRSGHTATTLLDGTVLIVGGEEGGAATTAVRYNPLTNGWTAAGSLGLKVSRFAATLLLGGDVVVTGGAGSNNAPVATAMRYEPLSNSWKPFDSLGTPRANHSALLVKGQVLAIGGEGNVAATSAERYDTSDGAVCYEETGRCVYGSFLAYWQGHGQLPINGYPLSNPFPEQLEDGRVYLVQYFERVRMESHPEQPAPFDILLGQFGRRIHPADPPVSPQAGARFFALTGHNVSGGFLAYWEANGGLAQFGYPLTETITETLEDGKPYKVQYFERARFEYHPENAAPYDVLLGQFGRQILAGR